MSNIPFSNFKYQELDTTISGVHEVCVSYKFKEKNLRRIVFVKDKKKVNAINEAKKIINQEIRNGRLLKYSKKMSGLKVSAHPGLKIALAISAIAAVGVGGTFAYMHFKPGDTPIVATTTFEIDEDSYELVEYKGKNPVIGKDYSVTLILKEDRRLIDEDYVEVYCEETLLEKGEDKDYTLELLDENEATNPHKYKLTVFAKAVKGKIRIKNIRLVSESQEEFTRDQAKQWVSDNYLNPIPLPTAIKGRAYWDFTKTESEETPFLGFLINAFPFASEVGVKPGNKSDVSGVEITSKQADTFYKKYFSTYINTLSINSFDRYFNSQRNFKFYIDSVSNTLVAELVSQDSDGEGSVSTMMAFDAEGIPCLVRMSGNNSVALKNIGINKFDGYMECSSIEFGGMAAKIDVKGDDKTKDGFTISPNQATVNLPFTGIITLNNNEAELNYDKFSLLNIDSEYYTITKVNTTDGSKKYKLKINGDFVKDAITIHAEALTWQDADLNTIKKIANSIKMRLPQSKEEIINLLRKRGGEGKLHYELKGLVSTNSNNEELPIIEDNYMDFKLLDLNSRDIYFKKRWLKDKTSGVYSKRYNVYLPNTKTDEKGMTIKSDSTGIYTYYSKDESKTPSLETIANSPESQIDNYIKNEAFEYDKSSELYNEYMDYLLEGTDSEVVKPIDILLTSSDITLKSAKSLGDSGSSLICSASAKITPVAFGDNAAELDADLEFTILNYIFTSLSISVKMGETEAIRLSYNLSMESVESEYDPAWPIEID